MHRLRSVILTLFLLPAALSAQSIAKYAGEFMAIGVGGRALGLGGAYVALANDATAGYWNPAALARINYPETVLMHDERFGGLLNYDYGAVAIPYGPDESFGLSISRLGVDDIADTRNALIDFNGNGTLDPTDRIDSSRVGFFNAADWAITFTYANRYSRDFSYGVNLKLIRRLVGSSSATGIGFDIGALYSPIENLTLGANLQDVTTTLVAWSTGRNELISPTLKLGATYFIEAFDGRFAPTMDVDLRFENRRFASIANVGPISIDPHFGLEFDFKQTVAVRLGYSDVKQMTVGAGLHLKKLDVDYSFAHFGKENGLGDTHRISIRFVLQDPEYKRWGGVRVSE
jgi:hypothetical protein